MNSNQDELNELINNIDTCEKGPEVIEWMKEVSKKEFGLIDSLVLTFLEEFTKKSPLIHTILRALTKLNECIPEIITPSLQENKDFPLVLSKYIIDIPLKDLEGGVFFLLVSIFSADGFKSVTNAPFINSLLNSLGYIQDEPTFMAIVKILINISLEQKDFKDDIVLQNSIKHNNQRFFAEYLVQVLNKARNNEVIGFISFFKRIFELEKIQNSQFFYTNDLKVICDILLREIGNTNNEDFRENYLELLEKLVLTKQYQNDKYHKSEFKALLEELVFSEVSEKSKKTAQKILENI